MAAEDELPDFDEEEQGEGKKEEAAKDVEGEGKKGSYAAIHASGFKDFLLKPEPLRAIVGCGLEQPSEVQHECISQAILGTDFLCKAKLRVYFQILPPTSRKGSLYMNDLI